VNDEDLTSLLHNPKSAKALYDAYIEAGGHAEIYIREILHNLDQQPDEVEWFAEHLGLK
jgi:hypothetical protein